jgi:hypothetical protein
MVLTDRGEKRCIRQRWHPPCLKKRHVYRVVFTVAHLFLSFFMQFTTKKIDLFVVLLRFLDIYFFIRFVFMNRLIYL